MRLNFSGVGEDDIREGVRRIGEVVREQVALYGTLTGTRRRAAGRRAARRRSPTPARRRAAAARAASAAPARRARREPRRRPQGRALARAPGLAAVRRARAGRARAARPRRSSAIDVGHDLVARLRDGRARRRVRRAARPRRRGRHGPGAARGRSGIPYTGSRRVGAASAAPTRSSPSTRCATPASRRRTSSRSTRPRSRSSARPTRCRAIEERLGFPIVVKPADQGSALGHQVRARPRPTCPARSSRRSPTTRKVLLERHVARARPRGVACSTASALPVVEAVPRDEDFYDFEARYEIGRTQFVCPAELPRRGRPRARRSWRSRRATLLGCRGFARVDLMLDDATASCSCSRPTRSRA